EVPFAVRVDQNLVDGTTYKAPLYVDAQPTGGSATMNPPAGWLDVSRHIVPLPRDGGAMAGGQLFFAPAGGGERNTVVEGVIGYEDGDTANNLGFVSGDTKASRYIKVQIVDMADPDDSFGEGATDNSGAFSIPVEDVPDNRNLGLLLE